MPHLEGLGGNLLTPGGRPNADEQIEYDCCH